MKTILNFNPKIVILFLYGAFSAVELNVIGAAAVSELSILFFLFLYRKSLIALFSRHLNLYLLFFLWLLGIILSDYINSISIISTTKHVGAAVLLILNFSVLAVLLDRSLNRLLSLLFGVGLSHIIQYYFFPSSALASMLEAGFDPSLLSEIYFTISFFPLTIFMVSLAGYFGYRKTALAIVLFYGFLALAYDRRSIFLVCFLAFSLLFLYRPVRFHSIKFQSVVAFLLVPVFGLIAYKFYSFAALDGIFGYDAQQKYLAQANVSTFGILSGRLDFFQGLYAFSERPFFGYGSYQLDYYGVRQRANDFFNVGLPAYSLGLPGHSHIVGELVFSGVLSLPFWLIVCRHLLLSILFYREYSQRLVYVVVPTALYCFWNVLFSPFSGRVFLGMTLAVLLTYRKSEREALSHG